MHHRVDAKLASWPYPSTSTLYTPKLACETESMVYSSTQNLSLTDIYYHPCGTKIAKNTILTKCLSLGVPACTPFHDNGQICHEILDPGCMVYGMMPDRLQNRWTNACDKKHL